TRLPACRWSSSSRGFLKRRCCVLSTIEYLEDCDQLGNLQDLLRVTTKAGQLYATAGLFGRCEQSYQGSQSAAVNVRDARQVQHDFAAVIQEPSDTLAECRRLLAEVDDTVEPENHDVIDFAGDNIERHDISRPQLLTRAGLLVTTYSL